MKHFIISILLACAYVACTYSILPLNSQLGTAYYPMMQVEIYSGLFQWGSRAIILTREGLILRTSYSSAKRRKSMFIDVEDISRKQLDDINNFLERHDYLKGLDSLYYSNPNAFTVPRKYVLRSYIDDYFSTILDKDYLQYQEKDYIDRTLLDSLVILVNRLVPRGYRQEYFIKDFSGIREPSGY